MKIFLDWIKSMFTVCEHDYEHTNDINVYYSSYDSLPMYTKRVYICRKCLKKKTIRL